MVHEVEVGRNARLRYSKIKEVSDMPNLSRGTERLL